MTRPSPAYVLAEKLYNGLNYERYGEAFAENTPNSQIMCAGEVDGQEVLQRLNLIRNGISYFSTVFTRLGGNIRVERITPESDPSLINPLISSIHMEVLAAIALRRALNTEINL